MVAVPAVAAFHPVADRPYRFDKIELHEDSHGSLRFALHRTVVFHRNGMGWTATVTTDGIDHSPGQAGELFAASNRGLLHRPLVLHLDADGRITVIDDLDTAWRAFVDGIERMPPPANWTGHEPPPASAIAAAIRNAPTAQRIAMLSSGVDELVLATSPAIGTRTVNLPARTPGATPLTGSEAVTIGSDGTIRIVTHATGTLTQFGTTSGGLHARAGGGTVTLDRAREFDRTTGLIAHAREVTVVALAAAPSQRARSETTITFTLK